MLGENDVPSDDAEPSPTTPMTMLDDAALCELVRSQPVDSRASAAAFGELYERHSEAAMANAYRVLGDRDAAEDAVSEAFAKSLGALRRGLGPSESFLGYLMTSVRTEALRGSRMERSTAAVAPEQLLESSALADRLSTEDHATALSERDQLLRAFRSLPESWRRVLLLVEVEGATIAEAAKTLGSSLSATNSLAGRAREGLRSAYLQQYAAVALPACAGIADQLARFVRGGLQQRRAVKVRAHLEGCPACTEQVARLVRINEQLKTFIGPAIAGGGVVGAATAIAAEAERGSRAAALWKVGAAAAVAGVAAVILWPHPSEPAAGPKPITEISRPQSSPQPTVEIEPSQQPAPEAAPRAQEPMPGEPSVRPAPWEDDASRNWVLID